MSFEFFQVVPVAAAKLTWRAAIRDSVPATPAVAADLLSALDHVLAGDIHAACDVPGFDRSTVDGFAVKAADTFGASEGQPAYLMVSGEVLMGQIAAAPVMSGQAIRIATGAMLPPGADAVAMLEYTELLPTGDLSLTKPVSPGENVIHRAEDVAAGDVVLRAGRRLRPADLGLLSAVGVTSVSVHRKPRVAIVSTGDEVVAPGDDPRPGQVRDINSLALAGLVTQAGGEPVSFGIVRDDPVAMTARFGQALADTEMLLISGGSSVGSRDYVAGAIAALGGPGVLVHGIQIRPGKPTLLAVAGGKPVMGLPGHPASAMVVFLVFGAQAVGWLAGSTADDEIVPGVRARLTRNLASDQGREDYVRVALTRDPATGDWLAEPVLGKSGLIRTLVVGDGMVRIPAGSEGLAAGQPVDVWLPGGLR